ncbi:class I SAM-dependent methyltransferase [Devosia sp. MC521]|uniref:class I SAM-dependent methyltransferase n=1 Tax=Devosia sp. MC521 TaxID=2759954 RepID=UPI0015F931DB|nr:class I SAM-dependent methyltransferase [Devosia sp. MC521]MBJ6989006.1 class I SAM-dependent methyltransferase [Devosia sp. MC521]QMW62965.1 class I SAM-dependent methyltransferase [Devosia sp. MC521]
MLSDAVGRFSSTGPILDVGGGNGLVAMALLDAGFPTIVVEPGPAAAAICVRRKVPVIEATLQDLDLENGSLDAVGMFDVLEHIEEDGATLAQIHALLRPGGHLYLTVPAYRWLWSPEDVDAGHYRRYTRASLARVLREAGFEIQYQSYLFSALVAPLFIVRTLMGRLSALKAGRARQSASEHKLPDNFIGRLLGRSLSREARRISRGGTVKIGTSCFAVARARTKGIK